VLHPQEVADGVVQVALGVSAHGVAVAGVQQADTAEVIRRMRYGRSADLAQVLPSISLDQAIERVVDVIVARLDSAVAEVDRLLRVVADVGDVAGGVVGIVQVL
jgi:uncharacterized membrane protein YheB (UPF0754 family)